MTYNIHFGHGRDGRVDLHRIARVIRSVKPDLIALQEVDYLRRRSGRVAQGEAIARLLEMDYAAGHNWFLDEGAYGNVFLARWPVRRVENIDLSVYRYEPRGCLVTDVLIGARRLRIGTVHLGLGLEERRRQCYRLHHAIEQPFDLLLGDFNAFPRSWVSRTLRQSYRDAFEQSGQGGGRTFQKLGIGFRLDYIYCGPGWRPIDCQIERAGEAAVASDHFPVVARILAGPRPPSAKAAAANFGVSATRSLNDAPTHLDPVQTHPAGRHDRFGNHSGHWARPAG